MSRKQIVSSHHHPHCQKTYFQTWEEKKTEKVKKIKKKEGKNE